MRLSLLGALSFTAAFVCSIAVLPLHVHANVPGSIAQAQPGEPDSTTPSATPRDSAAAAPNDSTAAATSDEAAPRGSDPGGEFAPTTEVPWNPSKKVPRAEQWESVLRTPGRILSLPFVALGAMTQPVLLMAQETNLVPRVMYVLKFRDRGLVLTPASLGDRTGWGATVGFALPMPNPIVHAGISGSTRKYSGFGAGVAGGPLTLDYGYTWRPDELFYGFGLDASLDDRSAFASQSEIVQLKAMYPQPRRNRPPSRARLSAWGGPRSLVVRTGRSRDRDETPSFEDPFPSLGAINLDHRVEHLTYGARAELDRRSGRPHWSHGSRVAFQFDRYDRPIEALALHSGQAEGAQFTRYRVEGEISRSISRDPRTLRLSFAAVDQRLSNGSRPLQLPDFVTLGGSAGLGGYEVGRFRDLDLLEAKLMYIFPLLEYLEFDIHYETGGVYADIERDPRLDTLKHTAGFAFRPRLPMGPLGAIGIDWSKERTRFRFSLGGVE